MEREKALETVEEVEEASLEREARRSEEAAEAMIKAFVC